MDVPFDPRRPLHVRVRLESPQVVRYRLWRRRPGAAAWTVFATGDHHRPDRRFRLDALPDGSEIAYHLEFVGTRETPFRARLALAQSDAPPAPPVVIEGVLDEDGVVVRRGRLRLASRPSPEPPT